MTHPALRRHGWFLEYRDRDLATGRLKRRRVALGHRNRRRAEAQVREVAAALAAGTVAPADARTLRTLFDIYEGEVTGTKAPGTQAHDRRTMRLVLGCFGSDRDP